MPLLDRLVQSVPGGFENIDRVAVTIGPGSFTGLRVGISAARAIGLAAEIPRRRRHHAFRSARATGRCR